jgi:hypothetical protein
MMSPQSLGFELKKAISATQFRCLNHSHSLQASREVEESDICYTISVLYQSHSLKASQGLKKVISATKFRCLYQSHQFASSQGLKKVISATQFRFYSKATSLQASQGLKKVISATKFRCLYQSHQFASSQGLKKVISATQFPSHRGWKRTRCHPESFDTRLTPHSSFRYRIGLFFELCVYLPCSSATPRKHTKNEVIHMLLGQKC